MMKLRHLFRSGETIALAAVAAWFPASALAESKLTGLPRNAAEHTVGPAYLKAPQPEANPWADKGIPSKHAFGAFYTRKHYANEKWHEISRTGEYSDIVVRFGEGPLQVVFGRVSSYHPEILLGGKVLSSFAELIEREGDGPERRPDKVSRYARARVIASNDRRALVHYRYMPVMPAQETMTRLNPPNQRRFVDEYFIFRPDRSGLRAFRPGTDRVEDWRDPSRIQVTSFQIGEDGKVSVKNATVDDRRTILDEMGFRGAPERSPMPAPLMERSPDSPKPVLSWAFDEGQGRKTKETISGDDCQIEGHAAIWRRGVSGHALLFDGYTSVLQYPAKERVKGEQITLSAWFSIAAYPWNSCPIVQQGDVLTQGNGVALGIGPNGRPLLAIGSGEGRVLLYADEEKFRIPRFQWVHLAGMIDQKAQEARLYLNGEIVSRASLSGKVVEWAEDQPVKIGQGPAFDASWPVGRVYGPSPYGFEGLIDEVEIFHALVTPTPSSVRPARKETPDMERRVLPSGDKDWRDFGGHYTHLGYHESWDSMYRFSGHPDIVVTFDKIPGRYVFWHGVNYIPMMVNENDQWYSNEFNETWWHGGFEPMSDKRVVFGRVHIIEQSPARVVVRWRYPLSNIAYKIYADGWADDSGWGEWCDWYFTIYPDGSCVKRMRAWMSLSHGREWQESMVILGPEQDPAQVIESRPTLTFGTLDGTIRNYDWIKDPPTGVDYSDVSLQVINMKADYDPYTICSPVKRGNVYEKRDEKPAAIFPAWNHWPVGQFPSCGRYLRYPDRAAHCSITHLYWDLSSGFQEHGSFEEKVLLEGLSDYSAEQLVELARSYLNPPEVQPIGKGLEVVWDRNTRAYVMTRESGSVTRMGVTLKATQRRPSVNPVFVVENWGNDRKGDLLVNGNKISDKVDVRQGIVRRPNGVNVLIIWIEGVYRESTRFEIGM